jgi:uncharacterized membrane protein YeiH
MDIPYFIDLFGTFVFAISGTLAVNRKEHDVFGAGFMGFITALGGGTLRDMTLGAFPIAWVANPSYLVAILLAIVITHFLHKNLEKLRKTFLLFDTLGIAFFAVAGTQKALSLDVNPIASILMGMFSAVMGGVIRDTLLNNTPVIFKKVIYASACLAGGTSFVALFYLNCNATVNVVVSCSVVIIIRLLGIKYKWSLPTFGR